MLTSGCLEELCEGGQNLTKVTLFSQIFDYKALQQTKQDIDYTCVYRNHTHTQAHTHTHTSDHTANTPPSIQDFGRLSRNFEHFFVWLLLSERSPSDVWKRSITLLCSADSQGLTYSYLRYTEKCTHACINTHTHHTTHIYYYQCFE